MKPLNSTHRYFLRFSMRIKAFQYLLIVQKRFIFCLALCSSERRHKAKQAQNSKKKVSLFSLLYQERMNNCCVPNMQRHLSITRYSLTPRVLVI